MKVVRVYACVRSHNLCVYGLCIPVMYTDIIIIIIIIFIRRILTIIFSVNYNNIYMFSSKGLHKNMLIFCCCCPSCEYRYVYTNTTCGHIRINIHVIPALISKTREVIPPPQPIAGGLSSMSSHSSNILSRSWYRGHVYISKATSGHSSLTRYRYARYARFALRMTRSLYLRVYALSCVRVCGVYVWDIDIQY